MLTLCTSGSASSVGALSKPGVRPRAEASFDSDMLEPQSSARWRAAELRSNCLKEKLMVTGEGVSGGWSINVDAAVPLTLGLDLDFSTSGPGSWSFGFSGGSVGGMELGDGATKTFPISQGSAKGDAKVTLTAKESE